ncbi:hypothetical protein OAQ99_00190 [Candidatus Kapabacteria bacterium]|nr:hypothetical protein [Candidatus Kapabacteria bacterium]
MKLIIWILVFSSFHVFAQNKDSIITQQKIDRLELKLVYMSERLDSVVGYNEKLMQNNYSLRNRLMEYEVKDDFFDSAFNSQSYRFTLIVASLFTLTLILVYASYNYQSKMLNDKFGGQILSQKRSFVELRGKIEDLEYNMYISLGNISNLLSEFHLKNKNPFLSIKYALISSNYIFQATKIDNRKREDKKRWENACLTMLVIAFDTINKLQINETYINAFRTQQDELFEQLSAVSISKNSEIHEYATRIKLVIKDIVKS